ncbi:MAG: 3-oxoacyl-[acyl-carrier-protein] reductase [Spirochaetia bacterium]
MLLKDKVAFITGGSRGIGYEIAKTFLNEGAHVYYTEIVDTPVTKELEELAKKNGSKVACLTSNVSVEQDCIDVIKKVHEMAGRLDIVINNAGITKDGLIFRMKSEDWNAVLNINLTGAFYICREASNIMIKQRTGSIINMASIVGEIGNAGQTNYSASKAGLIGFSKSLAREVATRGVRVNAIAPGFIQTAMTDALNEEQKDALLKNVPLGCMGQAQDIANAALFLASHLSGYITGQVMNVNGGMHMGGN